MFSLRSDKLATVAKVSFRSIDMLVVDLLQLLAVVSEELVVSTAS